MAANKKKKGVRVRPKRPQPENRRPADGIGGRDVYSGRMAGESASRPAPRPAGGNAQAAGDRRADRTRVHPGVPVAPYTGMDDFRDLDQIGMQDSETYKKVERIRQLEKPPVKRMPKRRAPQIQPLQVVKGGKTARRIRLAVSLAAAAAIVLTVVILHFSTPVGLIEWVQNAAAAAGPGDGYPVFLSDEQPQEICAQGNEVLVLSDTLLEAYNKNGRQIYSRQHGFSNPAMDVGAARVLVYDRGGTGVKIYNNDRLLEERRLEQSIYTAAIGRNGSAAFVTRADGYTAQVSVVDKEFASVYNWWSAEELVSAVALSDDGKRMAAAALRAEGGQYVSTLYVFDLTKSAPVATLSYGTAVIAGLESRGGRLTVITDASVSTVDWNCEGALAAGQTGRVDYPVTDELRQVYFGKDTTLLVTGRANDETAGRIILLGKEGNEAASFSVEDSLKYAAAGHKYIYCLFDHQVRAYLPDGTLAGEWDCGYTAAQLVALSSGQAVTVESGRLIAYGPPEEPAASE